MPIFGVLAVSPYNAMEGYVSTMVVTASSSISYKVRNYLGYPNQPISSNRFMQIITLLYYITDGMV